MRVCLVGAFRSVEGGAESYQRDLIPALLDREHDVALLHERPRPPDRADLLPTDADVPAWCIADAGADAAFRSFGAWQPDVAYVHGVGDPETERRVLGHVPAVLFAHSYYGTCATGTKLHRLPWAAHCRRTLGPACLALHYPRRCGGLHPRTAWRGYALQRRRRTLLDRYRSICVASDHMRAEYLRHDIPADRLRVTPLPPAGVDAVAPRPVRPPTGRLVFVGRVTAMKGLPYLLRAMPVAAGSLGMALSLDVVGSGPDAAAAVAEAKNLGLAVTFHGWVDAGRRNALVGAADILVMPSVWPEPWGLTGLEAGRLGIPTVAFASGGIPGWLDPGRGGELAPADPPTPQGLADALVRALRDPQHYAALCRGALETSRRYTMEAHLHALVPILGEAVDA